MTATTTKPARTMRFADGKLTITDHGKADVYTVIETPCTIGGRGFLVHKHEDVYPYQVHIEGRNSSCSCLGCLRWNRCKHVDALAVLINRGQL